MIKVGGIEMGTYGSAFVWFLAGLLNINDRGNIGDSLTTAIAVLLLQYYYDSFITFVIAQWNSE